MTRTRIFYPLEPLFLFLYSLSLSLTHTLSLSLSLLFLSLLRLSLKAQHTGRVLDGCVEGATRVEYIT